MEGYRAAAQAVLEAVNQVILGKEAFTVQILEALLADGHVLLEDIPGVGKTTLALAFSKLMGLDWKRVQFTPDVLPSDLSGFSIYRRDQEKFVYQPGAVFCNLLLADEINRTSPKTQSALLETMEERQVTVDGVTREVPSPFFVIATQNPLGAAGTQPLPMAQMDRFMVCLAMGYPDFENEVQMARESGDGRRTDHLRPLMNTKALLEMQKEVSQVFVHDAVYRYIVRLISATRQNPSFDTGVSPRGTIALVKMAQASAWLKGNDFVTPSDVAARFGSVAVHRVQLSGKARMDGVSKEAVLGQILKDTERPVPKRK